METEPVLADIERFLVETGMGESYFGRRATGNSELVRRLRKGKTITTRTEKAIRGFISSERTQRAKGQPQQCQPT